MGDDNGIGMAVIFGLLVCVGVFGAGKLYGESRGIEKGYVIVCKQIDWKLDLCENIKQQRLEP